MATRRDRKTTICNKHSEIAGLCEELLDVINEKPIGKGYFKKLKSIIKKINKVVDKAAADGQAMEDRLTQYREAIENLGFKRLKKR